MKLLQATIFMMVLFSMSLFAASPRMALIEEATNASCGPCASQNPSFTAYIQENQVEKNIIPIIYHAWWPGSDVMYSENPDQNRNRIEYYSIQTMGVPVAVVNGEFIPATGGSYEGAPGNIPALTDLVDSYQGTSPLTVDVSQEISGSTVNVTVNVSSDEAFSNKTIHIAGVEAFHYYENAGSNGERDFFYIMRRINNEGNGESFSIGAGGTETFTFSYDLNSEWNEEFMYAVAFIQDDATKEILQAGETNLPLVFEPEIDASLAYFMEPKGTTVTTTVSINNTLDQEVTYGINTGANSIIPNGWTVSFDPTEVTVPANGTGTVDVNVTIGETTGYAEVAYSVNASGVPGYIGIPFAGSMGVMSDDVETVFYYGTNGQLMSTANAIANNDLWGGAFALASINGALAGGFPAENFENIVLSVDYNNRGLFGTPSDISTAIYNYIKAGTDAGKNVLMSSELEMFFATASNTQSPQAKSFFEDMLGIRMGGTQPTIRLNTQTNQLTPFDVNGREGTEFEGLSFTGNQSNTGYVFYTENIQRIAGVENELLADYGSAANGAIVGRELENGAKVMYTSFTLEAISNGNDQQQLVDAIIEWFGAAPMPEITASSDMIQFGEVATGSTAMEMIEITNTGNAPLELSATNITGAEAAAFSFITGNVSNPVTLAAGETHEIELRFMPTDGGTHMANLTVESNAGDVTVSLLGSGVSSVIDGVAGKEGVFTMEAGPNPFETQSTITYNVGGATAKTVEINLVNAAGQIVNQLVNDITAPGSYTIDLQSNSLPAGNYYLVGTAADYQAQLPIVIVK